MVVCLKRIWAKDTFKFCNCQSAVYSQKAEIIYTSVWLLVGFLDSLRYISKHTGIMTTPENLQQEAAGKVHQHFLDTQSPQYEVGMSLVSNQSPNQQYDQPSPKFSSQPPTPQMTAPPSPRVTTPVGTPRVVTPVPGSHHPSVSSTPRSTPLPTPTASPPRTPVVGRRSMKRDSVRSTESRSRSNSPESVDIKNKRRTSYRYTFVFLTHLSLKVL